MFRHRTDIPLRFSDMDAFGHINNARFLTYFEQARISYFDQITEWKYDWSKEGLILAKADVDFKSPCHFRDKVFIMTRCSKTGNKSFTLEQKMYRETEKEDALIANALTVAVMFDYEKNQSIPIVEKWRIAIDKFEGRLS